MRSLALTSILILLVFHTLVAARSLLLPIVLALLGHLALSPPIRALARARVPAPVGAALLLLGLLAAGGFGFLRLSEPAVAWLERAPETLPAIERKLRVVKEPLEQVTQATERVEKATQVDAAPRTEVTVRPPGLAEVLLTQTTSVVATAAVTLVLLYFLLSGSDGLLRKFVELLPRLRDKRRAVETVREIEHEVSRYLLTISVINAGLGCAIAAVTWAFGLPNPLLWGVLAGVLNFVPYLGMLVASAIIGGAALLSLDEPLRALLVPFACWAVSAFEGALLTPAILGRRLPLSPVVIFVGLLVWGWLWGPAGALIAVPTLMVAKIACDRTERLHWVGLLLGR